VEERNNSLVTFSANGLRGSVVIRYAGPPSPTNLASELRRFSQLKKAVKNAPEFVIETMIPFSTVNLVAGDSGIGKSPLFYQLGLCVAAGLPFMGFPTRQGKVLYIDYENGERNQEQLIERLAGFLGISESVVEENFSGITNPGTPKDVDRVIAEFKPSLVIVDSLRGYEPNAERKSGDGEFLKERWDTARGHNTSFLLIHHLNKETEESPLPDLRTTLTMTALNKASGSRGLVNQTETRIAVAGSGDDVIVMRGFAKMKGEFGPIYIKRVRDEHGDPLGYVQMPPSEVAKAQLTPEVRAVLDSLGAEFTFSEMQKALGKSPSSTVLLLTKLQGFGLVKKDLRTKLYAKVHLD